MSLTLESLRYIGISPLAIGFAEMLQRHAPDASETALVGAAAAVHQSMLGHVCADIPALAGLPVEPTGEKGSEDAVWPEVATWLRAVSAAPFVSGGETVRPLVVDGAGRLYLHRLYRAECELAKRLRDLSAAVETVDEPTLNRDAALLFGTGDDDGTSAARHAAKRAVQGRLTVITGGPGAGKTTLTAALLALLIRQHLVQGRATPRILLLAPTGKAAQRLAESVRDAAPGTVEPFGDDAPEIAAALPREASTIHRALGGFRGDEHRRGVVTGERFLSADTAVVDEASMVDPMLLLALLRRLKPTTRLILVGDKDQLSSVESGALLGDIFDAASAPDSPLRSSVVSLTGSHRFKGGGGIGKLAECVNAGDASAAVSLLSTDTSGELSWIRETDPSRIAKLLSAEAAQAFAPVASAKTPSEKLFALSQFRVLTPHRRGSLGCSALNRMVADALERQCVISQNRRFYEGRPLLVTQNRYEERLFNGDTGIVVLDESGREVAAFEGEGGVRLISPSRLPEVETAFAMTVHKSQGSQFDRVVLVLPERVSPVTVRELIYTAITRARTSLCLVGSEAVLRVAVETVTRRRSGLRDRLNADFDSE